MITKITVFTPTYNRGHLIDRLYQSLLRQTNWNFEWIVVDDGSTDDTSAYFETILAKQNPFLIRYEKQPNGGKHRAINKGVSIAKGELFFIVDSDDYLTENAIEKLFQWEATLDASHKFAGVSGVRGYSLENAIGEVYTNEAYIDARNTQREKFHLRGDKAEAYYTNILRQYPFPEIEGEKFLTEEVVWNAIACDNYYLRWFSEIIYVGNYLEGGLTNDNSKNINNPQGVLLWAKGQVRAFPHDVKFQMQAILTYFAVVKWKKPIKEIAQELEIPVVYLYFCVIAQKMKHLLKKAK